MGHKLPLKWETIQSNLYKRKNLETVRCGVLQDSILVISSIHKFNLKIQPLLEFYDLSGHSHFLVILPKKREFHLMKTWR